MPACATVAAHVAEAAKKKEPGVCRLEGWLELHLSEGVKIDRFAGSVNFIKRSDAVAGPKKQDPPYAGRPALVVRPG